MQNEAGQSIDIYIPRKWYVSYPTPPCRDIAIINEH